MLVCSLPCSFLVRYSLSKSPVGFKALLVLETIRQSFSLDNFVIFQSILPENVTLVFIPFDENSATEFGFEKDFVL